MDFGIASKIPLNMNTIVCVRDLLTELEGHHWTLNYDNYAYEVMQLVDSLRESWNIDVYC